MPRHTESRVLPYTPEQIFDVVADVAKYPEFLPWIQAMRIRSRGENVVVADMVVGFKMIREHFTSKVTLVRPLTIHVDYISGPLKYLRNDWRFEPHGGGTLVHFAVDFEFAAKIFEKLAGLFFSDAFRRMVASFEARARVLYPSAIAASLPAPAAQPTPKPASVGISSSSATSTA